MYFYELGYHRFINFRGLAVIRVYSEEWKTVADCRKAGGNGWGVSGVIPPTQTNGKPNRGE